MRKVFLAFALSLLFGCDGGQEGVSDSPMPKPVEFSVQTDDVTVNKLLPAIKNMLPGLNRYADQFQIPTLNKTIGSQSCFIFLKMQKSPQTISLREIIASLKLIKKAQPLKCPREPVNLLL